MLHLAAFLFAALGLAHSVLGERYILIRLFRRDDLPRLFGGTEFTKRTLRFAWHLTTILSFGFAALLVQLATDAPASVLVRTIGWISILSGFLPLVFTRGRHLSWLGLFAAGGLCLFWSARFSG
jgi:hypothetical protein